jgi:hypothetical protein
MKVKNDGRAGRAVRQARTKRLGAKSKAVQPLPTPEISGRAGKKPQVILSAVFLANGEEAVVRKYRDGTYDITTESSTYWRIPEEQYTKLPAPRRAQPHQDPHQFVRMEQGGLPSLGKRR